MSVVRPARALPALLALLAAARGTPAPAGTVEVRVRDAVRGTAVRATISDAEGRFLARSAPSARLDLGPGTLRLTASADGYRPLDALLAGGAGDTLPVTIWLDPLEPPAQLRPPAIRERTPAGHLLLHGTVLDAESLEPIGGASARVPERNLAATTDSRGGFALAVPSGDGASIPPFVSLTVEAPGRRAHVVRRLAALPGDLHLLVDLSRGEGVDAREDAPAAAASPEAAWGPAPGAVSGPLATSLRPLPVEPSLTSVDPPGSIRVGTGCSCTTCSSVSVMSLETYVRRGLNDEWIASWAPASLASGAAAYRSYGSWYVLHPIAASYDICSTTCCQVNDADTSAATDAAADATAGILLHSGGAVFRSEYSAEDNAWDDPADGLTCTNADLSCGDGSAGSPAASWPCVADAVCAGHGCFGHGRGMCQWGTQRWASAQGKAWPWIANHYYNSNGSPAGQRSAFLTTPLTFAAVSAAPARVASGGTFTISLDVTNRAGSPHSRLIVGASLHSPATGYLSDPASEAPQSAPVGTTRLSRPFTVPGGTPDGLYDLVVALWLDADGDSAITGSDLALTSQTLAAAVGIGPADLSAFPAALDFGVLTAGTSATLPVSVRNHTPGALAVSAGVSTASSSPWLAVSPASTPVPPGGTVRLDVTASADPLAAACADTGTLTVAGGPEPLSIPAALAVGPSLAAARLHTVVPCRLVDTRPGSGAPHGGPSLTGGVVREFGTAPACGIPPDALALVANVTVVGPASDGDLRLFPAASCRPLASTLNFRAGAVRANSAIVSLAPTGPSAGRFTVLPDLPAGATADLVVDVSGYFR